MTTIQSVAELAWRQVYPNPSDETPVSLAEFIETAKLEYAFQTWRMALEEKEREGWMDIASNLMVESDPLPVENNSVDISKLKIAEFLPEGKWLQGIGGFDCDCRYIKTTIGLYQLLCEDDSLDEGDKLFYVLGKKILFPLGTHADEVTVVYASTGEDLEDGTPIDEVVGAVVRVRLIEIYMGKTGVEDETNNSSSNS